MVFPGISEGSVKCTHEVLHSGLIGELWSCEKGILDRNMKTYLLPDGSITQALAAVDVPRKETNPLCVKENGTILTPESFKYVARVILYELGTTLFRAHCLRHTHGTILAEGGVNPKTVIERLGHKDISTTLQTYTFNTDLMQQTAVNVFEKAIQA